MENVFKTIIEISGSHEDLVDLSNIIRLKSSIITCYDQNKLIVKSKVDISKETIINISKRFPGLKFHVKNVKDVKEITSYNYPEMDMVNLLIILAIVASDVVLFYLM